MLIVPGTEREANSQTSGGDPVPEKKTESSENGDVPGTDAESDDEDHEDGDAESKSNELDGKQGPAAESEEDDGGFWSKQHGETC